MSAFGRLSRNLATSDVMPLFRMLSPRYMTKVSLPRNPRAVRTAWASPSGASCSM